MEFFENLKSWADEVNLELDRLLRYESAPESKIYEAMRYSLLAGGKRLRPVLALAVSKMLGGDETKIMPYACAIEMIHTYSLIHDDLPAMDNDDYRRGRLTSHKVFGDATAILAGDALLNKAFEVMLTKACQEQENTKLYVKAALIVAEAAGTSGMIGGQVVDLLFEGRLADAETLKYMHRHKTGALIKAPVLSAAVLCGASSNEYEHLEIFSENIGLAFQIKDDIMDSEGTMEEMGKPAGSDQSSGKSTYATIYGTEKAKKMLEESIDKALEALEYFGDKADFLKDLALFIKNRKL